MSPAFGFTMPRKKRAFSSAANLVSKDDEEAEESRPRRMLRISSSQRRSFPVRCSRHELHSLKSSTLFTAHCYANNPPRDNLSPPGNWFAPPLVSGRESSVPQVSRLSRPDDRWRDSHTGYGTRTRFSGASVVPANNPDVCAGLFRN
jgi:hypothetical protein